MNGRQAEGKPEIGPYQRLYRRLPEIQYRLPEGGVTAPRRGVRSQSQFDWAALDSPAFKQTLPIRARGGLEVRPCGRDPTLAAMLIRRRSGMRREEAER